MFAKKKRDHPDANDIQKAVREYITDNLAEAGFNDPKIFIVDNLDIQAYDFQNINRQLLYDCDDIKREALTLSLSNLTEKTFLKKKRGTAETKFGKSYGNCVRIA